MKSTLLQIVFSTIIVLLFFAGCKENGIAPPINPLQVSIEDVSCTEAWITLSLPEEERARILTFQRNGATVFTTPLVGHDTSFIDKGLLPRQLYTYTLIRRASYDAKGLTTSTQVRTLDTTSHVFYWQIDSLGGVQSTIEGIWGSSGTDIWAVGYFYIEKAPMQHVAHYDGTRWKYQHSFTDTSRTSIQAGEITAICGTDPTNIWVAGYGFTNVWHKDSVWGYVAHWNGKEWKPMSPNAPNVQLFAIYAADERNIWAAGTSGSIYYYNGSAWTQQPSGTPMALYGISGPDAHNVYAVGADWGIPLHIVLHYDGTQWSKVQIAESEMWPLRSVNALSPRAVWVVGDIGVYRFNGRQWGDCPIPGLNITLRSIKGNAQNDIYIGGDLGLMAHFNGVSWKVYLDQFPGQEEFYVNDIAVLNDRTCFAGRGGSGFNRKGIIIMAKH